MNRPEPAQATDRDTEADRIADAVAACPSVARLDLGGVPHVATYLPGRRVEGVRVTDTRITLAVVGRYGTPVPVLDAEVRAAVAPHTAGRVVDVRVVDLEGW